LSAEDWRRWNAILEAKFPELRKENAANATTEKPNKEYEADCRRWNAILEAKFPELRETSKPES
jgi:hypothetical protein